MMESVYKKRVTVASLVINGLTCVSCGTVFGLSEDFEDRRRQDKQTFYCPNGHPQLFMRSELEKLREQNVSLRSRLDQLYAERDSLAGAVMDKAKEIGRLKRHSQAGLCSECRRHFTNLERHMASKHSGQEGP